MRFARSRRPCPPWQTLRAQAGHAHARLHQFVAAFHEAGKLLAVVCHGTCILLKTRLAHGTLLVHGKTWTGFADAEEQYVGAFVDQRIQPFWVEEEARQLEGTNFVVGARFAPFAVRDGRRSRLPAASSGAWR